MRVEAGAEAERRNPAAEGIDVSHLSHDGPRRQLLDLAWLIARHPLRVLTDLGARRRWRRDEPVRPLRALAAAARRVARHGDQHLHAHFAAGAALDALRISLLLGIPYSVTAHAYDIYLSPANLREKLERAAFATSGCEYTVRDLRAIAPAAHIHEIVMGVDGRSFERVRPYPGGRTVVAVGRLVEKKGFVHLIEAAGLLRGSAPLETVTIVGDGPLREELAIRVRELGLDDTIELAGVATPVEVRELLQDADLLVMPCVIAGNGDRDSMPVVVKEAMAMEVPVVASDEVGLPELVRPAFGRLVPPGDPVALAGAIEELLALPAKRRAEMGAAGRAFVLEHCDVMHETQRLADLMAAP